MAEVNTRKDWIDIMKGIGILCVVAGHIVGGATTKVIYIFHMPLFFFLGGYLFRERKKLKEYFIDKFIHLIVPYFAFLLLIYVPVQLHDISQNHFDIKTLLRFISPILVGGRTLGASVSVFWFVTCFFIVQQVFNFIVTKYKSGTTFVITLIMLILSYFNSIFIPKLWLPWNANVVLAALPIFYIGFLYKKYDFQENRILIVSVSILAILSAIYTGKISYNMKVAEYGIPIITLLCSVCMILFIKNLSLLIARFPKLSIAFKELGKASMIIMYLHQPVQLIITYNICSNELLRFLLSTFISYIIYLFILKFSPLRALLLGSKEDFKKLFPHFKYSTTN